MSDQGKKFAVTPITVAGGPIPKTVGDVQFQPWTDGFAIGFRVVNTVTGDVEYVYLHPSVEGDGDGDELIGTVFLYTGPVGDPGDGDEAVAHLDLLDNAQREVGVMEAWMADGSHDPDSCDLPCGQARTAPVHQPPSCGCGGDHWVCRWPERDVDDESDVGGEAEAAAGIAAVERAMAAGIDVHQLNDQLAALIEQAGRRGSDDTVDDLTHLVAGFLADLPARTPSPVETAVFGSPEHLAALAELNQAPPTTTPKEL